MFFEICVEENNTPFFHRLRWLKHFGLLLTCGLGVVVSLFLNLGGKSPDDSFHCFLYRALVEIACLVCAGGEFGLRCKAWRQKFKERTFMLFWL